MYEIVITKIANEKVTTQEWMKLADSGNPTGGGPLYGYADKTETKSVKYEIYRQTVEQLDLADVVSVVNGIMADMINIVTQKPDMEGIAKHFQGSKGKVQP